MKWTGNRIFWASVTAQALALAGCSSGDGGGATTAPLSIGLSDGPVDAAEHVWIQFTGLELISGDGPPESHPFDPDSCDVYDSSTETCTIDLLALQGTQQRTIFAKDMPVGAYESIRLMVNAELNTMDSYIELYDENSNLLMCSLWIPSGSQTGLKLQGGLDVTNNGSRYMLDFDVRKSIVQPPGLGGAMGTEPTVAEMCAENYLMKPTIRIVDETESGSMAGVIARSLLYTASTDGSETLVDGCRDEDMDGVVDNLDVYVFEDFADQPVAATLDDYDGEGDPVSSAIVEYDPDTLEYAYEVGYLLTGNYLLGLTCTADVDVQEEDNFCPDGQACQSTMTDPVFDFIASRTVDLQAGMNDSVDMPAP